jgi:hypothetical protein
MDAANRVSYLHRPLSPTAESGDNLDPLLLTPSTPNDELLSIRPAVFTITPCLLLTSLGGQLRRNGFIYDRCLDCPVLREPCCIPLMVQSARTHPWTQNRRYAYLHNPTSSLN